jgi:hypothetical protein
MSLNAVTQAVGLINHLWLAILGDEHHRAFVGVRYIGHGWDDDPYWLLWFQERPGVYRLELKEAVSEGEYDWLADFLVKYFPAKTESAFHGLSSLEKLLRDSDVFDTRPNDGCSGGCPCQAIGHDHSGRQFEDLTEGCGVPQKEIAEDIPPDFFFAGHLSIAHRAGAGTVITAKSQTYWRVEMSADYRVLGEDGAVITLLKKDSVDRNYPGLDITSFLYRRFTAGWSCFYDASAQTECRWSADGFVFRSDGLTLNCETCNQIRRVILQTTIVTKPGVRLIPPVDSDKEGMKTEC